MLIEVVFFYFLTFSFAYHESLSILNSNFFFNILQIILNFLLLFILFYRPHFPFLLKLLLFLFHVLINLFQLVLSELLF